MKTYCNAFMSDLQQRDIQQLEKWFTEESVVWIPPANPLKGRRKILVLFRAIFSKYKDLNWQIQQVHEVEDHRCIYLTQSWGELKNGTPYKNHIVTDILFNQNGEIIDLSDYFKDTAAFSS